MKDTHMLETQSIFLQELAELIQDIERDLLHLETTPEDRALVDRLFRNLHTIKGGAGGAGMEPLAQYTHAVENMLDMLRTGRLALSQDLASLLLEAVDCLKSFQAEATGEAPLDVEKTNRSHHKILSAIGAKGLPKVAAPPAPVESPAPAPPVLAERDAPPEKTPPLRPETFLAQIHVRREALPSDEEQEQVEAALRELGDLLAISHEHNLPPEGGGEPDAYYLWRSFHLVASCDRARVEEALGDWRTRHNVEFSTMTLLPESPPNQDAIDAEAAKDAHVVLGERACAPPAALFDSASPDRFQAHSSQKLSSIRVDIGKLDNLVNLVGEMITTEARLDRFQESLELHATESSVALRNILDDSSRTLRELQDHALNMRMVPIGSVFDLMHRLVRDYCRLSGKQARLTVSGQETEVDKKVCEQISGPLKHLLRNSLDHGLESPEERLSKGKAAMGELLLRAYQQFGLIVIEVKDDGRGIDVAQVVASARAKGLVAEGAELSEREALELIFAPSVSTAAKVTEVSGRGVGMDVVKRDIEAMRGAVEVVTEHGKGTSVTVSIPLTLAIIDGLLVRVGESYYVVPLSYVEEHLEIPIKDIRSCATNFLDSREELVPLLLLRDLFSIAGEPPATEKIVVVTTGERRVGLVVDQLMGYQQTVIKSLSPLHKDVRCFSGATILGDGRVALILDVLHLIELGQDSAERLRAF